MSQTNPDFLNGIPELLILQQLTMQPMHGYQLVERLELAGNDVLKFGEGSVYPVLHKLVKKKLLKSTREKVNGRTRVVYEITNAGTKQLAASAERFEGIAGTVLSILKGGSHVAA
jgi:PadR family transcriptional regulator PadR